MNSLQCRSPRTEVRKCSYWLKAILGHTVSAHRRQLESVVLIRPVLVSPSSTFRGCCPTACESTPTCCCFDPYKAGLAFAATVDGTVALWDLRESPSLHKQRGVGGASVHIRHPTYSTEGISTADNHVAPIVGIMPISVAGGSGSSASEGSETSSFQLATLDAEGVFKTWTVIELPATDMAGSLQELGLLPGGRVKVSPSGSVQLDLSHFNLQAQLAADRLLQTFCFQFFPDHPNQ